MSHEKLCARVKELERMVSYLDRKEKDIANITTLVEPVVDLDVAAELIPTTPKRLRDFLYRHREEYNPTTIYRLDINRRRRRMLRISDIKKIRRQYLRGPGVERTFHG